jgi:hypothetical protein
MLSVNRKGFKLEIPLSDKELWGIGMVSYQWSQTEFFVDAFLRSALGERFGDEVDSRASFIRRANLLRNTIQGEAKEPWRTALVSALDHITGIKIDRDRIIHQTWSEDMSGNVGVTGIAKGKLKGKDWNIDHVKLREVAMKIEHAHSSMFLPLMNAVGLGKPIFEAAWELITSEHG